MRELPDGPKPEQQSATEPLLDAPVPQSQEPLTRQQGERPRESPMVAQPQVAVPFRARVQQASLLALVQPWAGPVLLSAPSWPLPPQPLLPLAA